MRAVSFSPNATRMNDMKRDSAEGRLSPERGHVMGEVASDIEAEMTASVSHTK